MEFYLLLRRLSRAEYTKSNEYRRHVTMSAVFQSGEVIDVTMDTVSEYYNMVTYFVNYIQDNLKTLLK